MASTYNLIIDQATTFIQQLEYKDSDCVPIDLTGYESKLQVRENYGDADPALITLELGSGIEIDESIITFTFLPEHTIDLECKKYVYDLLIKSPEDVVTRLIQGIFEITMAVTIDIS